jgi:hypothetical protein
LAVAEQTQVARGQAVEGAGVCRDEVVRQARRGVEGSKRNNKIVFEGY